MLGSLPPVVALVPLYIMLKDPPPPDRLTVFALGLSVPFFAFGTGSEFKWDVPLLGEMEFTELKESLNKVTKENERLQIAVADLNKNIGQTLAATRTPSYKTVGFGVEVDRHAKSYTPADFNAWVNALPPKVKMIAVSPDAKTTETLKSLGMKFKFVGPMTYGLIDAAEFNNPVPKMQK